MSRNEIEMVFPEDTVPTAMARHPHGGALMKPSQAREILVRNQDELTAANEFLRDLKRLEAQIAETFDPQISKAHSLHKSLLAEKKKFTEPLAVAERIVKPRIAAYLDEEDRRRREAEIERLKAEAEASAIADEALEKAKTLDESGNKTAANEIINTAFDRAQEVLDKAPEVPEAVQAKGLSLCENWRFEIVDVAALPREYMKPDEVKIGRIVRALRSQANIPGVRIWSEKTVTSRIGTRG